MDSPEWSFSRRAIIVAIEANEPAVSLEGERARLCFRKLWGAKDGV